ncbi:hypothetical protein [Egicoccus sp. AB-alg2]
MLHLLRLIAVAIVGTWGVLRALEEAFGAWVRRASRPRDLDGVAWA